MSAAAKLLAAKCRKAQQCVASFEGADVGLRQLGDIHVDLVERLDVASDRVEQVERTTLRGVFEVVGMADQEIDGWDLIDPDGSMRARHRPADSGDSAADGAAEEEVGGPGQAPETHPVADLTLRTPLGPGLGGRSSAAVLARHKALASRRERMRWVPWDAVDAKHGRKARESEFAVLNSLERVYASMNDELNVMRDAADGLDKLAVECRALCAGKGSGGAAGMRYPPAPAPGESQAPGGYDAERRHRGVLLGECAMAVDELAAVHRNRLAHAELIVGEMMDLGGSGEGKFGQTVEACRALSKRLKGGLPSYFFGDHFETPDPQGDSDVEFWTSTTGEVDVREVDKDASAAAGIVAEDDDLDTEDLSTPGAMRPDQIEDKVRNSITLFGLLFTELGMIP